MNIFDKIKDVFGSQSALAEKLDVDPMVVSQWKKRGRIPAERCHSIVEAAEGRIALHELRPDIYKNPTQAVA
jgi:DNA-binding transcriptional regulator YdaS (Cro superfamily)